jgi:hypothetical protein
MRIQTGATRTDERGITENIIVEIQESIYPYPKTTIKVIGEPINKNNSEYKNIKAELGDDWESDLTDIWFMPGETSAENFEKIRVIVDQIRG